MNHLFLFGGNILTIVDSVNGPQTQTFTYDTLDRLTSAAATGGTDGLYSESYSYDPSTGNLAAKGSLNLTYADSAHPHAATGLSNGNTYAYNAAGSTVTRVIGADTYSLAYDSENRLKTVQKNGAAMAEFLYDGNGTRVVSTINSVTTRFVGEYYEVTGSSVTKYYGGAAMRVDGALSYLLSDHLGSNSLILDTAGNVVGETRYTAWGEERYSSGLVSTDYTYTGQYSNTDDFGLMYYKARWYDPVLGRFVQADSIVPGAGNPISWDRYAYVKNNPVISNDPSGNMPCSEKYGCNAKNYSYKFSIPIADSIVQSAQERFMQSIDKYGLRLKYLGNGQNFGDDEIIRKWGAKLASEYWEQVNPELYDYVVGKGLIRSLGRIGGMYETISFIVGLGMVMTPNVIENINNEASLNKFGADIIVDTGGYVGPDIGGTIVLGFTSGNFVIATMADLYLGGLYDDYVSYKNWAGKITYHYNQVDEGKYAGYVAPGKPDHNIFGGH